VAQGAAKPVQLPDHQGVAGAQLVQDGGELGSVGAGATGAVGEHAVAAGLSERVDLEVGVLVGGGDTSVAEQVCSATRMPSTMSATRSRPDRSASSSSARACSVAATNRRETADLEVAVAACSTWLPTGSSPCW
jgi:hypothetical protein